jgi:hypothetical protein
MNRGRASFLVSLLLVGFAQLPTDAKPGKDSNLNKHKPPVAQAQSADKMQADTRQAGQQRSETKNSSTEAKSPITEIIQVQPAVLAGPKSETAKTFSAPAGALYTSSDECG